MKVCRTPFPHILKLHKTDDGIRNNVVVDHGRVLFLNILRIYSHEILLSVPESLRDCHARFREVRHAKKFLRVDSRVYRECFGDSIEYAPEDVREFLIKLFPKLGLGHASALGYPLELDDNASVEEIGSLGDEIDTIEAYRPAKLENRVIVVCEECPFRITFARHRTTEGI